MISRTRYWSDVIVAHGGTIVSLERSTHLKFTLDNGALFVVAKTPSDWRGELNSLAELRRLLGWKRSAKAVREPKRKAPAKREQSFDAPTWKSRREFTSPGRQQVNDAARRQRLGLEGRRVPEVKPAASRRPVLTLRGYRGSDPGADDLRGVIVATFEEEVVGRDLVSELVE